MNKWVGILDLEAVEVGNIISEKNTQPKLPCFSSSHRSFLTLFTRTEVIIVFSVTPSHYKETSSLMHVSIDKSCSF